MSNEAGSTMTPANPTAPATPSPDATPLSPRAAIAMLTLQLRAATQDAANAEREEADADEQAAREQLRARVEPLLDEHRRELDVTLAKERAAAAAAISAAHRAASVMLGQASPAELSLPPDGALAETVAAAAEPCPPEAPLLPQPDDLELAADPAALVAAAEPPTVEPVTAPEEAANPAAQSGTPVIAIPASSAPATVPPINIVIDAEAFARVFASVFATILDERMPARANGVYNGPMYAPMVLPAAPVKQSFWSHAKRVDVLLLGAAMVIVLVVLAAWLV
jgi:hypothetical protein